MQTHSFDAGGYRYVLTHAPARRSLQVCARLGNAGAALFAGMAQGRGAERLANAVAYLMQSPDLGPTLDFIVEEFSPYTQVLSLSDNKSATLKDCVDQHFAGRMDDFAKWIEAAVEFECGDFLGKLAERFLGALAAQRAAGSSGSPSPTAAETSGSSGA